MHASASKTLENSMKYIFQALIINTLLLVHLEANAASKCLRLAVSDGAAVLEKSSQTLSKILSSNSICHSLQKMPSKRLHAHFLKGEIDGDLGRVQSYRAQIGALGVMVETPLFSIDGFLVTKNKTINSVNDVKKSIGILRGRVWMTKTVEAMKNFKSVEVTEVNSMDVLAKLLKLDRVEAILVTERQLRSFSKLDNYKFVKVMELNVHVWLTKSNESLSSTFNALIKQHFENGGSFIQ